MRNSLAGIFVALLLIGCAGTPPQTLTSRTYREQLTVYKDMKIRLYKVAAPIKKSSVNLCSNVSVDSGIVTHRLSDYPEKMRDVAQSYWGLTDNEMVIYRNPSGKNLTCQTPLILDYDTAPNAYTDGQSIFVSPSLLNKVDDLSLALIIAHELGHIALKHVDKEPSEALERAADRFALFMLARAGIDYRKAALQDVASRQPHISEAQVYADTAKRAKYFREVVAEIEALQADGKPLVP